MTAAMVENQNAYEDLVFGVTTNPTDPYSHALIQAEMDVKTGGVTYTIENEPEMRVVPKLSLLVENESSMLKYVGEDIHSTIEVTIRNNLKGATGDIQVTAVPEDTTSGIQVSTKTVSIAAEDQTITVTLDGPSPRPIRTRALHWLSPRRCRTASPSLRAMKSSITTISIRRTTTRRLYRT